jgi:hypothetical protein
MVVIAGSSHMVPGSALFEVSLGDRTDDHCVAGRTYLHGLDHIGFAAVAAVAAAVVVVAAGGDGGGGWLGSHSALALELVENTCSCCWSMPW